MKTGVQYIEQERYRQIEIEKFNAEHDDNYNRNELVKAAAAYALPENNTIYIAGEIHFSFKRHALFPFMKKWWKPTPDDRINELSKAGALIAAEIDRLLRKQEKESKL